MYRVLGGAPRALVKRAFQLSALDKMVTKPYAVLSHLDDRDFLAQLEAVDRFTDNMIAYPGRTFGQMYHRFFRANDLPNGEVDFGGRRISLHEVKAPVLVVAGRGDGIAPNGAVARAGGRAGQRGGGPVRVGAGRSPRRARRSRRPHDDVGYVDEWITAVVDTRSRQPATAKQTAQEGRERRGGDRHQPDPPPHLLGRPRLAEVVSSRPEVAPARGPVVGSVPAGWSLAVTRQMSRTVARSAAGRRTPRVGCTDAGSRGQPWREPVLAGARAPPAVRYFSSRPASELASPGGAPRRERGAVWRLAPSRVGQARRSW